ncbi:hypothetical protein A7K93_01980 [Candidatus Methylacidiphilum fumarolicum]|nr:hypothetical protein A7K93_01980 [Candidatus Methylacidiphilum fumarolicum]
MHAQRVQQIFRAFDAAVEAVRRNRSDGRRTIYYPYKDKRFSPLMLAGLSNGNGGKAERSLYGTRRVVSNIIASRLAFAQIRLPDPLE